MLAETGSAERPGEIEKAVIALLRELAGLPPFVSGLLQESLVNFGSVILWVFRQIEHGNNRNHAVLNPRQGIQNLPFRPGEVDEKAVARIGGLTGQIKEARRGSLRPVQPRLTVRSFGLTHLGAH
jgi:hypothetical protein